MIDFDPETSLYNPYPCPFGGVYSVSYFYDKEDRPCPRKYAYTVLEVEYDENDEIVFSKVFNIHPQI